MKAFSQHSLSRRTLLGAGIAAGALSACPAFADLRIEITGVGANQIPIAIQPFQGASAAPTDPAEVIAADLERSGAFRRISVTQEASAENLENPKVLRLLVKRAQRSMSSAPCRRSVMDAGMSAVFL